MGLTMKFDLQAMSQQIDQTQDAVQLAIRPAVQAGAEVLYQAVLRNVQAIGSKTGNLNRAIYQVFSQDNSVFAVTSDGKTVATTATYHISWNAAKAPHGHLVEYGHLQTRVTYINKAGEWRTGKRRLAVPKQVGARPFIRPVQALMPQALSAVETKLKELVGVA